MSTQQTWQVLDREIAEAALHGPAPVDPIGQHRLRWMSAEQRRFLQGEIHGSAETIIGAFLFAYYNRLRLNPEVMAMLHASQGAPPRRAPDVRPPDDAEDLTVAVPRLRGAESPSARLERRRSPWMPGVHELE